MCRCLVLKDPQPSSGLSRGYVITVQDDDHQFSAGDLENHWIVDVPGKTRDSGLLLTEPMSRAAVPGEPEYDAPDEPDRVIYISPRKWYFAFDENQLSALQTYGGITLLPADAEITVKTTQSGGLFKFSG